MSDMPTELLLFRVYTEEQYLLASDIIQRLLAASGREYQSERTKSGTGIYVEIGNLPRVPTSWAVYRARLDEPGVPTLPPDYPQDQYPEVLRHPSYAPNSARPNQPED